MNEHHVTGALHEVGGRVQSAAGALAGDLADGLGAKRAKRAQDWKVLTATPWTSSTRQVSRLAARSRQIR